MSNYTAICPDCLKYLENMGSVCSCAPSRPAIAMSFIRDIIVPQHPQILVDIEQANGFKHPNILPVSEP